MKLAFIFAAFSISGLMTTTALAQGELQQCKQRCRKEFKGKPEALRLCKAECEEKWNNPKPLPGNKIENKETAPAK